MLAACRTSAIFSRSVIRSYSVNALIDPSHGLVGDTKAFQEAARTFADKELAPHMLEWDQHEIFPREKLKLAAGLGFGAIYCKEDYGGSGLGRLDASVIFEAMSTGLFN
jgi:isobutyryl-CoA dehydrogenase